MATPADVRHHISNGTSVSAYTHPLDPLYPAELEEAVEILAREKYLGDKVRIASINLIEPAKSLVEKHRPGDRKSVV